MSGVRKCIRCGGWFDDRQRHACPPAWRVWCPAHEECEDDAVLVHAPTAEDAAERWAEDAGIDDELLTGIGAPRIVLCVRGQDGRESRWSLSAEAVVQYHAEQLE